MYYQLREDLSCCDVDDRVIFLDIAQDRYFVLSGHLEDAMRRFIAHEDVASTLLQDLVAVRILVEATAPEAHVTITNIPTPTRSAIEQPARNADHRLNVAIVLEVMAIVWSTRHQLKTCALKTTLNKASTYRDGKISAHEIATSTTLEDRLLQANWQFARARRYVPIDPICLLDSLSLLRFLSRRKLLANIIFGVMPEPFAAHCWVQAGDIVLNETLSDAHAHTPIWWM